ncbi:response regulator [Paenibacillus sp. CF384]|uniref:response regulator n=1 Tax=Paenibacillus sp. CF384 TaxID=1884382 RepID=UPI00089529AF|nr:response regulator [Paenibacillus sp. CF384]SDX61597.1 two-component system, response regulator YesN [Paenibacillus sp. CF384]
MHQILLVDDERSVVDNLEVIIPWEELGVGTVYKAYSGDEAAVILDKNAVDVVITDIRMPGMSGLELIEYIRRTAKKTKCILLSGHAEFDFAKKALQVQADDYLIKPVADEELMEAVRKALLQLSKEWEELHSYKHLARLMQDNLPLIRRDLLDDLLHGQCPSDAVLAQKINMIELPFTPGDDVFMLLIRVEEGFAAFDRSRSVLLEFAMANIVEEVFGPYFAVWSGVDEHENLVFVLRSLEGTAAAVAHGSGGQRVVLERLAEQLQNHVGLYLKGHISIIISGPDLFPQRLQELYRSCLFAMRNKTGGERGFFILTDELPEGREFHALSSLHEPPSLILLIEAGRMEDLWAKLERIFREMAAGSAHFYERCMEVYYCLCTGFIHFAHQNGKSLAELIRPEDYALFDGPVHFRTVEGLRKWAFSVLEQLEFSVHQEIKDSRGMIVRQVNQFIERNLSQGISVPLIADQVHLHPAYLSRVYKLETGESISDYVYRTRMEKAVHLLKHTEVKIYEIAAKLGYQNDSYFIKVFKKHYGMTPQDCRDQ